MRIGSVMRKDPRGLFSCSDASLSQRFDIAGGAAVQAWHLAGGHRDDGVVDPHARQGRHGVFDQLDRVVADHQVGAKTRRVDVGVANPPRRLATQVIAAKDDPGVGSGGMEGDRHRLARPIAPAADGAGAV